MRDFLTIVVCFGALTYGCCAAKADESLPEARSHHSACLHVEWHSAPTVGAEPRQERAAQPAAKVASNPCPSGWTMEGGTCLPG